MLKIGHRGAAGYEPENTLRSFKRALELGVDMIELDVHLCKSGEVVVVHDDTVGRTTNGSGYVGQKTLTELRELDAGRGERIPTLPEVLDLIDKRARINIELKGPYTALAVSELIEQRVRDMRWGYEDFLISSFSKSELSTFRNRSPNTPIGLLLHETDILNLRYRKYAMLIGASSIHMPLNLASQRSVNFTKDSGKKVLVWVVNDPADIEFVKRLGVDGIFSDYPDRL